MSADRPSIFPQLVALLAWVAVGTTAMAQSDWQVDVIVPNVISVRMPTQDIAFGLTLEVYPPVSFPARYPATSPEGGVLPVEVFSNAEGGWSLLMEIPDLVDSVSQVVIRADQVLFRVNGGLWTRGNPSPQVIYSQTGPTDDWLLLEIEFQLELEGSERPGSFEVATHLTALVDGL